VKSKKKSRKPWAATWSWTQAGQCLVQRHRQGRPGRRGGELCLRPRGGDRVPRWLVVGHPQPRRGHMPVKVGVLADIHGDIVALDAALGRLHRWAAIQSSAPGI